MNMQRPCLAHISLSTTASALDGVYCSTEPVPAFDEMRAPGTDELQVLLGRSITRIMKILTRTGYLIGEQGISQLAEGDREKRLCLSPAPPLPTTAQT